MRKKVGFLLRNWLGLDVSLSPKDVRGIIKKNVIVGGGGVSI